jgi:hypothetical protein
LRISAVKGPGGFEDAIDNIAGFAVAAPTPAAKNGVPATVATVDEVPLFGFPEDRLYLQFAQIEPVFPIIFRLQRPRKRSILLRVAR